MSRIPIRLPAKTKYRNRKTVVDGITFDSAKEARRYQELMFLKGKRLIENLALQPEFTIDFNGVHVCNYRADFSYWRENQRVVEDVKGVRTAVYRLKKKLMWAHHGIAINEI